MILGTLNNLTVLEALGGNFATAVTYLKTTDLGALTPGHYEIDGDNVFANFYDVSLQEPSTLSFETHTHYADIQLIVDGCEGMWFAPYTADMVVRTPYETERDVTFYEDPALASELAVAAGQFVVFFPDDAHKPSCLTRDSRHAFKLVIKVKVA